MKKLLLPLVALVALGVTLPGCWSKCCKKQKPEQSCCAEPKETEFSSQVSERVSGPLSDTSVEWDADNDLK